MNKRSIKVSLIGKKKNNDHQIKFPQLEIPVNVNEELYQKMLQSEDYDFGQNRNTVSI